ncbi:MAG: helix-turn-helix domain-containing protein [Actinobacteria bacterium]|nr:helix-turn-helix domain-containing protein [Actinomycetota bacterium]
MSLSEYDSIIRAAEKQAEADIEAGLFDDLNNEVRRPTMKQRMLAVAISEELTKLESQDKPELLTITALAKVLSLGESTLRAHDKRGLIPAPRRIGGALLWSRKEIVDWIDNGSPPRQTWESRRLGYGQTKKTM